jgi:hypothetical protein
MYNLSWIGPEPDIFTYVVKPKPDLSPTYLVNFSSPPKYEAQAQKNQAQPTSMYNLPVSIFF